MMEKKIISEASSHAIHVNINKTRSNSIELLTAGLLLGYGLLDNKKNHSKQKKKQSEKTRVYTEQDIPENAGIDNSYSQLVASDISSYRYGKTMHGFVQG